LKLVRLDMGTMLLDELKTLKVLKQTHIELIRSNRFKVDRCYPLWVWLEWMSWMWYFDHDHLFFVIVDKLAYLLFLEWFEWLEVAHVITLSWCIWLLIAVPKIRRLWHPYIFASLHPRILASSHPCILNSNVISLNLILLFIIIISADWLFIQFKLPFHIPYIHNLSSHAILTAY
jgi:hypothetical protein